MNKKVWRNDKKLMVIVNTTATRLLESANGIKVFSVLLKEAFPGAFNIGDLNSESLENVNLAVELEDRFLQSAVFCVSMWERGLVKFTVKQGDPGNLTISPLLKSVIGTDGEISIVAVLEKLAAQNGGTGEIYAAFNQLRTNLLLLHAYDMLLLTFTGTFEDYSDQDKVQDTYLPHFRIGYVSPELIVTKSLAVADGVIRVEPATAIAAITVTTTVTTFSEMIGDSVGQAESR